MAESSLKNECCQDILERMQTVEINSDPAPMVVKNAAAAASLRVIPDINKKKKKPTIEISPVRARLLDYWNMRRVGKHAKAASSEIPGSDGRKDLRASTEKHIDPWLLRVTDPDCVPVAVEKDARSDIAEIDVKKYLVPKDALLEDFIAYVRMWIFLKKKKTYICLLQKHCTSHGCLYGCN
ncbi:PREDICTED: uncharacterized protein LOC103324543 [Prunus mume]|uniref:Autophagy-related protein n=1 Tax=Prunus mume TaxID=102107 RepID=A0ABM0NHE9_PRUMU|nr:PREDICTED: uncharacterized protein LOC103324543 [Prunus mume]